MEQYNALFEELDSLTARFLDANAIALSVLQDGGAVEKPKKGLLARLFG